jgi:AraC-like DNA-binding protein
MGPGKPPKPIDWNLVEAFIDAECNGKQIAGHFNIIPETFYERFYKEYGENFSIYSSRKCPGGEALLKLTQYKKALSGNTEMLKHLGKHRLGQNDTRELENTNSNLTVKIINYSELKHEKKD